MRVPRLVAASSIPLLMASCGAPPQSSEQTAQDREPSTNREAKAQPYDYPPPVKGHYAEVNTGEFDLVDGLAYGAASPVVVYAVSKPIASPVLSAECPMTEARALTALRDAGWLEVALKDDGSSDYFAAGTAFAGSSRETEVGGHYWKTRLDQRDGKAVGAARHKEHGGFDFELPLRRPTLSQISASEAADGHRGNASDPQPEKGAIVAAYQKLHEAAAARDLGRFLAEQGYSEAQATAVRGLAGIEEDFAVFADRFLAPGGPEETQIEQGYGGVGARGTNSKGAAFFNFYGFVPCGSRLVLVDIGENPQ
jgi:hypothetical protein